MSIFAIYPKISMLGIQYRREGFLSLLGYYLLFINWKTNGTKNDIKKYIKIFVIIGIINSIYALFQIYVPSLKFILKYAVDRGMASGICGNPNFYGSLMVTILGIITCKFLMTDKSKSSEIFLLILFIFSLINSQSTGPILTYILMILFMIFVLHIKKKLYVEKIMVLILMICLSYAMSFSFVKIISSTHIIKEDVQLKCELCNLKETVDTGGNGRWEIWKNSIDIVRKNPILGVGYDNLEFAYPNPKEEVYFYVTNNHIEKVIKGDK